MLSAIKRPYMCHYPVFGRGQHSVFLLAKPRRMNNGLSSSHCSHSCLDPLIEKRWHGN